MMLYVVVEMRTKVRQTGIVVTGLAFVLQFTGSAFSTGPAPRLILLTDPGYALHAALVLMAYTAMSLSFIYAVLYMVQSRQLRKRNFGLFFRRMPPLETLERMSVGAVKLAVPLLFVSLAMGHLWMYSLRDKVSADIAATLSPYDPKVISSWIIFLVYAGGVAGHQLLGWRGRRMNLLAIVAYVLVLLVMGLVHHFFPSFHDFSMRGGLS
jgi:HemX protein